MTDKLFAFGLMACLFSLFGCTNAAGQNYKNVSEDVFEKLIAQENVIILDSRTQEEFDEGHINGAVLIDVNKPDFKNLALKALDKKKQIAVYCRSGRRSRAAAEILTKEGYQVTNLDGGILSWTRSGKPISK